MDTILSKKKLTYNGKLLVRSENVDAHGEPLKPYLADSRLVEAVNLAIDLQKPLLIGGETGCGKTRLAQAVATELGLKYEAWYVKSTSRARDGLYIYDTVARLRDAQLAYLHSLRTEDTQRLNNPIEYIKWGPLGRAFRNETRTVVLIDEIDKADLDFPNDLLHELEDWTFTVDEPGIDLPPIKAKQPPIIFITSNNERDLPDAFLRRCLFHHIEFPTQNRLEEILQAHFPDPSKRVIKAVVKRFGELRDRIRLDKGAAGKNISTSELIDWFTVLSRFPDDEILLKLNGELPYKSVLLKSSEDYRRYLSGSKGGT